MATVNDEPRSDKECPGKLYQEAETLLRLAEGLQDRCERHQRRLYLADASGAGLTAALVTLAVYVSLQPHWDGWGWIPATVALYLDALLAACFWGFTRPRLRRLLTRDRRAVHGMVDLLRDMEKGIREENHLSALQHAQFSIRLGRFDIGPGRQGKLPEEPYTPAPWQNTPTASA